MLNRTVAPPTQLPQVINFPVADKEILQNSLPVYIIKGSTEPIVRLMLFFEAGRYYESKKEVAGFVASMINKGTATKNAFEIAETLEFYGASLQFQSNMYVASLSLNCLQSQLPYILPIVNDLLENASFPESELAQLQERAKQKLKINLKKNEFVASQHFNKMIFGETHPFGYLTTKEAIESVTVDDLKAHFKQHYTFNQNSFANAQGIILQLGNIASIQTNATDGDNSRFISSGVSAPGLCRNPPDVSQPLSSAQNVKGAVLVDVVQGTARLPESAPGSPNYGLIRFRVKVD